MQISRRTVMAAPLAGLAITAVSSGVGSSAAHAAPHKPTKPPKPTDPTTPATAGIFVNKVDGFSHETFIGTGVAYLVLAAVF